MALTALQALAASKQYTADTASEFGALKGASCQIGGYSFNTDDDTVINFLWENSKGESRTSDVIVKRGPQGEKGEKGEKGDPGTVENVSIADLDDVALTTLVTGSILVYNAVSKKWENKTQLDIPLKVLGDIDTQTEANLLALLVTNVGYACEGFFYDSDAKVQCSFKGTYIEKTIGGTSVHYGFCSIRGINESTYNVDYCIDDTSGKSWYKNTPIDYLPKSDEINLDDSTKLATSKAVKILNDKLEEEIKDIELFKFPNAVIHGTPTINNGQISGFAGTSYLALPSVFNLSGRGFEFKFAFTTGTDVATAQNVLGSKFCMALFIQNAKLNFRVSSDGSTWNLVSEEAAIVIEPNKNYYVKIDFNRLRYAVSISIDDETYNEIINVSTGDLSPNPAQLYIGIGNNYHNPFLGIVNLNKCYLKVNNSIIWQGMDDAGLSTRLATDLDNIDADGIEKIKEIVGGVGYIEDEATNPNDTLIKKKGVETDGTLKLQVNKDSYILGTPDSFTMQSTNDVSIATPKASVQIDNDGWVTQVARDQFEVSVHKEDASTHAISESGNLYMDNETAEINHSGNSLVVRNSTGNMSLESKGDIGITSEKDTSITSKGDVSVSGASVEVSASENSDIELKTSGTGKATYNGKEIIVNGNNDKGIGITGVGSSSINAVSSDSSIPYSAGISVSIAKDTKGDDKEVITTEAHITYFDSYDSFTLNSKEIKLGVSDTSVTSVKHELDVNGNEVINNGTLKIEHKDSTIDKSLEVSVSEDTSLIESDNDIKLKADNLELEGRVVVKGNSLLVDQITTNESDKILLNENTEVNGNLKVNGDLTLGDSTLKAMDFETKGGDFTIKDEDGAEIHKLSKKQDDLGIVDVEEVYPGELFKPKQLQVDGEFVAKSSDDTVGKTYKQRDSWLKMTRNGIRMGISSAVKFWEEIRHNYIELGNSKLTIFSTKRLHLESDEHIRMGSHYASNRYEQFNDSRPYSAEVDVSGNENRVDISNPYAMFSVNNNGIEIKSTGRDGYSYADMHIGGNISAGTWQTYHKLTPRGIPQDSDVLSDFRHKPLHNFVLNTQEGILLANHHYSRNFDRESGKYYIDWTRDSFVELGNSEAKIMVSKRLDETGYNRTSGDKFGIKCGPHSGVQVYGYLMGGGLDEYSEHGEKPLVVRGGLRVYTHYHTSYNEKPDAWEFKEDGIYFNGVKKVSV